VRPDNVEPAMLPNNAVTTSDKSVTNSSRIKETDTTEEMLVHVYVYTYIHNGANIYV
jgi:hypothetical protein